MPLLDAKTLELPARYLDMVRSILRAHVPDAGVWAYGSRVNGASYEASDLDLVLRNPGNLCKTTPAIGELREAFMESNLPIRVDVVDWARIPGSFHREIVAGYVVLQAPPASQTE